MTISVYAISTVQEYLEDGKYSFSGFFLAIAQTVNTYDAPCSGRHTVQRRLSLLLIIYESTDSAGSTNHKHSNDRPM